MGEGWGLAPEGCNRCRSIEKFPEWPRERFLTDAEFARLGQVLNEAVAGGCGSASAVVAIPLLMLTGCRMNEVHTLRWTDVDLEAGELRLAGANTRAVEIFPTTVPLLETLPRRTDRPRAFPGRDKDGRYSADGINHVWQTVSARAGPGDVLLHDLRQIFSSRALGLSEILPVIGKVLRHSNIGAKTRYAYLARDSVHEAAERIAESIAAHISQSLAIQPRRDAIESPTPPLTSSATKTSSRASSAVHTFSYLLTPLQ